MAQIRKTKKKQYPKEYQAAWRPATKPRQCLRCNQSFQSTGAGNRICSDCALENGRPANRVGGAERYSSMSSQRWNGVWSGSQ